jgi:hypothetical protein
MALQKPVIKNIVYLDATKDYIIEFNSISGDQVVSNEIEIYNNLTSTLVYTLKIDSFEFFHTIPLNTLTNNIEYKIRLRTYNISAQYSEWSSYDVFWCLLPATVTVTNIVNGKVNNETYTFTGSYVNSNSNDSLQSYKYFLYNIENNIVGFSSEIFDGLLLYEFSNLRNSEIYKVEIKTISTLGMENTSGLIQFIPDYIAPKLNSILTVENIYNEGSVKLTANIISVLGVIVSGSISYENNDWVNLLSGVIKFEEGFRFDSDFTMKIWCKSLVDNQVFLELFSPIGKIEIKRVGNRIEGFKYVTDSVGNKLGTIFSRFASNQLDFLSTDTLFIWVQHIDNLLDIRLEKVV